MSHESFALRIGGEEAIDLYRDLISLEVELSEDAAAAVRLMLAIGPDSDGRWSYLDDERLLPWNEVQIDAGFNGAIDPLFSGYITHVRPRFEPNLAACRLEIWALDRTVLMDREDRLKDWPDKKDSDIAREIFDGYGLESDIEDTAVVHDARISTIMQRESDIRFLRRLAARNGFNCYVEHKRAVFRSPDYSGEPQPPLAAHFGAETNLLTISLEVDATLPSEVALTQIDRFSKEILASRVEADRQTLLGRLSGANLSPPARRLSIGRNIVATTLPELSLIAQSVYQQSGWFVFGEATVDGNRYNHVLRPYRTVTIKGIGATYSGIYAVSQVRHMFQRDGYTQHIRVKRNALLPSGDENFTGIRRTDLVRLP